MPDQLDAAREERNWEFWRNEARRVGAEFAEQAARYEALVEAGVALRPKIIAPALVEWAKFCAALAALEHEEGN